ncbi:hypothetical protein F4818DRAFT_423274 [Hypoxylon cercidicola]|nr:hypothetical protein F4818DRAFT_423274 [Hypoxylon cercidicola]
MESHGPVFHLFPRLPPELRLAIWRECLPHRVVELQRPLGCGSFSTFTFQERKPCKFKLVTDKNSRPPLISRVCRESRAVAFETGGILGHDPDGANPHPGYHNPLLDGADYLGLLRDDDIDQHPEDHNPWLDTARDVIHTHYESFFETDFGPDFGNQLRYVAGVAARTKTDQASFNLGCLLRPFTLQHLSHFGQKVTAPLRLRSSWLVIVYVVIVHMNPEAASTTGLFGLLGDAPVQIVDLRDNAKINAFNDLALLALASEQKPSAGQHLDRDTLEKVLAEMKSLLGELGEGGEVYGEREEINPAIYPAVMFRLCTKGCRRVG